MNGFSIIELLDLINQGYFLHGSRHRLDTIEPRQARCKTGRPHGNLCAVYAAEDPVIPCLMAMFCQKDKRRRGFNCEYTNSTGILVVNGDNVTFSPGFVHVLPADTFQRVEGEIVSFVPVRPVGAIEVTPSILWEILGYIDMDLQIPIPKPW